MVFISMGSSMAKDAFNLNQEMFMMATSIMVNLKALEFTIIILNRRLHMEILMEVRLSISISNTLGFLHPLWVDLFYLHNIVLIMEEIIVNVK
jgi:hypothetical protein